ncbi:hypothetical protein [Pelotalea chapellei]|uniref:Response regulatory domain-containing protein n=1 Tax=Pelotalea chapellei TaxID=44671 RepID=A0ABS5U8X7_9BACT|nr:hypothetical protein [Pelotalea chapellei]MBT1072119.1 hypothetical protein [Pelotalea chapellei]
MTDLLLITDVPRLLKVFSPLAEERNLRLRVATNLEKGAEEIVAEKPGIVFVQTHLSGLSAEILLMHLKKQLGRRRSRFVLLCPGDQLSGEAVKLYHGHIDTALDDTLLLDSVRDMISTLVSPRKKNVAQPSDPADSVPAVVEEEENEEPVRQGIDSDATAFVPLKYEQEFQSSSVSGPSPEEHSLEEQGVVYGRRPQISVYSEFTSSFDDAVSSMPTQEPLTSSQNWSHESRIASEPAPGRSRRAMFLLWLAPVLIAAVVITILQHRKSKPEPVEVVATPPSGPAAKPKEVLPATPVTVQPAVPSPIPPAASAVIATPSVSTAQTPVPSAAVKPSVSANRLTVLPEFVPRYGRDKSYAADHPGWERYKGQVTEFKIFREGESIKAIQIIDRGGRGLPDSFMKSALKQVTKSPAFAVTSSEKKGDYTIQRGQVSENINAVYYRDASGSKLRAFVITWQ